jgi:hypothetical protein
LSIIAKSLVDYIKFAVSSGECGLRLTRILRSTRLLGLEDESHALYQCLANLYDSAEHRGYEHVSPETYRYWQAAAQALELP